MKKYPEIKKFINGVAFLVVFVVVLVLLDSVSEIAISLAETKEDAFYFGALGGVAFIVILSRIFHDRP